MYMTCQTLDFSHTIGSANSPWSSVFIYERYPLGLGFTQKAYELLHLVMPGVLDHLRRCDCEDGCPVCTGKPLRGYTTWNVERGEGAIPSRSAAIMVLEGLLGDGTNLNCPDTYSLSDGEMAQELELELALRRRLERMREPEVFHPIQPQSEVETQYPAIEDTEELPVKPGSSIAIPWATRATDVPNRPTVSSDGARGHTPSRDTRPQVVLRPTTPQHAAGVRIEPAVSVPVGPDGNALGIPADAPGVAGVGSSRPYQVEVVGADVLGVCPSDRE